MNSQDLRFSPSPWLVQTARFLLGVGAAVFLLGWIFEPQRTWANVLLVSVFLLGIGLGSIFLVACLELCGARWAGAIRGLPERLWVFIIVGAVGIIATLILCPSLYPWPWAGHEASAEVKHHLHGFREVWLERPFFMVRSVVLLGVWILLARMVVITSGRPSVPGAAGCGRWSAIYIVVLMLTVWIAVSDWIMSLDAMFYSTMFGMYCFAGFFVSAISVVILLAIWLRRLGVWRETLTDAHLHDLGKLQFAFCTFWMYVWFSQYMLIWYTNNPEETTYFIQRVEGAWRPLFVLSLFLNWIIPFFALLSAHAKRNANIMGKIAAIILVGHWLDLYIMILPTTHSSGVDEAAGFGLPFGIWEIGLAALGFGLFILTFLRVVGSHNDRVMTGRLVTGQ